MASKEVEKAREQRKIDRLKYKTQAEKLKLKAKEARIEARIKNGGVGGSIALYDRRDLPKKDCRKR